jgi:hypothetical protein
MMSMTEYLLQDVNLYDFRSSLLRFFSFYSFIFVLVRQHGRKKNAMENIFMHVYQGDFRCVLRLTKEIIFV